MNRLRLHPLVVIAICGWAALTGAAEVDVSRLPAAATNTVDFDRDIRPIFEQTCFRCHGPEKPKSNFRLDIREAALKGGDNGVAIIPGRSADSPLIHMVAGLVEDMEMPPKGKGDPLTSQQISLLRAWIDQGAPWGAAIAISKSEGSISTAVQWINVTGQGSAFREQNWRRDGLTAGIDHFELRERLDDKARAIITGRAWRDDYRVRLTLERDDLGFLRAGAEEFHKFSSDSGGYYPAFTPPIFSLDRDLRLDVGRAWFDAGLTLPNWPRIVLGYEYQYREGDKSTLQWGLVTQGTNMANIYPASKRINEDVHIIKFDLSHTIAGVLIEDSFRGEFYDLGTSRRNATSFDPASPGTATFQSYRDNQSYFQGANTIRLERQFNSWLLGSAGYLYSKLDGDAAFQGDNVQPTFTQQTRAEDLTLERESHVVNVNSLLGPWDGLTIAAAAQADWTRQESFGSSIESFSASPVDFIPEFSSDLDRATVEESVKVRYTKIPFTVLFAEGRLQQESIGHYEESIDQSGSGFQDFLRDTDASSDLRDWRAGFSVSPWRLATLTAHYRGYDKSSSYEHLDDLIPIPPPLGPFANEGYSAFIRSREVDSDEVEARLALRATRWLKLALSYKYTTTDYETETDAAFGGAISPGGWILAGEHRAHIYGINAALTPWRRLYWSTTLAWHDTRIETFDNGLASVVPYEGDVYSVISAATFALNTKTDLHGTYSFSTADYSQSNFGTGLPLGLEYRRHTVEAGVTRRWLKSLSTRLIYAFYKYDEPSTAHYNDYTAHGVFGIITMFWGK